MVKVLPAAAYARMMKLLLPPGRLWNLAPDSLLSKVLLAAGDELHRVNQRSADLIEETDPRTTDELLPEFERLLELTSIGTTAERRARVMALLVRRRRFRPVDYQQALAGLLGQAPGAVDVIERSSTFAASMGDQREIYRYFIYRDPTAPSTYDLEAAQSLVDEMEPAHTKGYVIESIDFLCDDAFSLCDRDLLGV